MPSIKAAIKTVTKTLMSAAGAILALLAISQLLVPAVSTLFFGASPAWLVGSVLFTFAAGLTVYRGGLATGLVLSVISAVSIVAALLLAASYYVQGEGFNSQFFYHLDPQTLVVASSAYADLFYLALGLLCLAFVVPMLLGRHAVARDGVRSLSRRSAGFLFVLWSLTLVTNYPLLSYLDFRLSAAHASTGSFSLDAPPTHDELEYLRDLSRKPGALYNKNIILIYAESLEQLYFDQQLFGVDLMPNLRQLKDQAQNFTRMRQLPESGATMTGIIASQCGFPVQLSTYLAANTTLATVDSPYEREYCLGDALRDNGYTTVFMGGASLEFAGKGKFLKTHGYGEPMGLNALAPKLPDPDYRHDWGLYDDSLFDLARDRLEVLESGDGHYLLTLLTLDTHHPAGFLANSCKKLEDAGQMENAIHCSDQLISAFIRDAMAMTDPKETIIVLFSDHLSMRNTLWDKLQSRTDDRRLNFMIFNAESGRVLEVPGTHYDVAPTILEAAGMPGNLRLGMGHSLFYKDQHDGHVDVDVVTGTGALPTLLDAKASSKEFGIQISLDRQSLTVGDREFKAHAEGGKFFSESGMFMFMIVFDDLGVPQDTIFSKDYASLAAGLDGRFAAGISVFAKRPDELSYFYGPITVDGKHVVQRPLVRDVEITAPEVTRAMRLQ